MTRKLNTQIPFVCSALIFVIALSGIALESCRTNDGHLVYTLDDPYIHMAIAKNLATHGVFGVSPYEFSSATSSPLWTLLLAVLFKLIGNFVWIPGILATVFALAALYTTNSLCRLFDLERIPRFITCCAVLLCTPLVTMVATGMEHSMHLFFALLLIITTVRFMECPGRKALSFLCLAALLGTATRYETLFLVAPIALFLLMRKHWYSASLLVMSSFVPVIAFGAFSVANGSYVLPNSLMLKGRFPNFDGTSSFINALGYDAIKVLQVSLPLYSISLMLLLGGFFLGKRKKHLLLITIFVIGSLFLHLQLARIGIFSRYVAVLGCMYQKPAQVLPGSWKDREETLPRLALLAGVALLVWPLLNQSTRSLSDIRKASYHVYQQQYHMGQFLRMMYEPGARVAVNDLGAVTYYADLDVLDLFGLASIEVTRAKRDHRWNTEGIEQELRDKKTDVVMVYRNWFRGKLELPGHLVHVADWTTVGGFWGKTVSFFATSEEVAKVLRRRLGRYEHNLPDAVEVNYEIPRQDTDHDR